MALMYALYSIEPWALGTVVARTLRISFKDIVCVRSGVQSSQCPVIRKRTVNFCSAQRAQSVCAGDSNETINL